MLDQILKSDLLEQANQHAETLGLVVMLAIIVVGFAVIAAQRSR